ncbi:MAG: transketolase family protein [Patescibacteria group bacterium]|nr:transketolase family protein [Patescibacteria group bacterium]
MINSLAKLSNKIFSDELEQESTRQGYGEGLVIAGQEDDRVVVVCADLTESTRSILFKEKFPDRFIEAGVAEQLIATVGSGLANYGKIPFVASYAAFSPGRNWEQIRTTICLNNVPVKIVGAHAGISVGPDGATHQMLEDIALMRVLPNMVVVVPCDAQEAKKATIALAQNGKPSYIRLTREKTPVMTTDNTPFKIGKAIVFWESKNPEVTIIACGPLLYEALIAAKDLDKNGIGSIVINNHTIKPLDRSAILSAVKKTNAIVTVEEHQISGGLGGAISEFLAQNYPVPIEFVGVHDSFGESGVPGELLEKYGMKPRDIVNAVKRVIERKNI